MKQIQKETPFTLLGLNLIPEEREAGDDSCYGCHFYRKIGLYMGCMYPHLACAPEDNDLGQNLIIKQIKK